MGIQWETAHVNAANAVLCIDELMEFALQLGRQDRGWVVAFPGLKADVGPLLIFLQEKKRRGELLNVALL